MGSNSLKAGIYKLTFTNGHYYIGQAIDLRRRELQHYRELKKNSHTNKRVQYCFNKYGLPIFEVIEECSKEFLNETETKYITKYLSDVSCCNICPEGRSRLGTKLSDDSKKLISDYQRLKGKAKPVYMFSRDEGFLIGKFDTIRCAAKYLNCHPSDVRKSCNSNGHFNVKQYKFQHAYPIDNLLNYIKQLVPL